MSLNRKMDSCHSVLPFYLFCLLLSLPYLEQQFWCTQFTGDNDSSQIAGQAIFAGWTGHTSRATQARPVRSAGHRFQSYGAQPGLATQRIHGFQQDSGTEDLTSDSPFWQTWWFLLISAILWVGTVFGLLQRIYRFRSGNRLLEKEVVERTEEFRRQKQQLEKILEERKQTETELKKTKDAYLDLFEEAPIGYHEIDANGIISRVNQTEAQLLGYDKSEMIGKPVFDFIVESEISQRAVQEKMNLLMPLQGFDRTFRRKDGSTIVLQIEDRLLFDENGNAKGIRSTLQDVTERNEAEEMRKIYTDKLEKSNQELEEFAHVASHDLREPLRKISIFGERLKEKCGTELGEIGLDYLVRMQNAAARMQELINDLLTYARVTTEARPFKTIDMSEIVREVLTDLEVSIEESNAKVHVKELSKLEADPAQMRQLMQNLIGNALKYHKRERPPVISIQSRILNGEHSNAGEANSGDKRCEIMVTDNGIGFGEEFSETIFGVFQRLHGSSEYEGAGLGLAICRKIVERHGGEIRAEGTKGEGASFMATLPITQSIKG